MLQNLLYREAVRFSMSLMSSILASQSKIEGVIDCFHRAEIHALQHSEGELLKKTYIE